MKIKSNIECQKHVFTRPVGVYKKNIPYIIFYIVDLCEVSKAIIV